MNLEKILIKIANNMQIIHDHQLWRVTKQSPMQTGMSSHVG